MIKHCSCGFRSQWCNAFLWFLPCAKAVLLWQSSTHIHTSHLWVSYIGRMYMYLSHDCLGQQITGAYNLDTSSMPSVSVIDNWYNLLGLVQCSPVMGAQKTLFLCYSICPDGHSTCPNEHSTQDSPWLTDNVQFLIWSPPNIAAHNLLILCGSICHTLAPQWHCDWCHIFPTYIQCNLVHIWDGCLNTLMISSGALDASHFSTSSRIL